MKKEKCETCKFYFPYDEIFSSRSGEGECRVHSPKIVPEIDDMGHFPVVDKDNWCGEYKNKTIKSK